MLKYNYLAVLQFQLRLKLKHDSKNDYLIVNDDYLQQIQKSISIICELEPDIIIFPEMSYQKTYDKFFKELSRSGKLIVFGSTYINSINYTMIFHEGNLIPVKKMFSCGSEPMVRFTQKTSLEDFLTNHLHNHKFEVKQNTVYVLNCLEYYEAAYRIARSQELSEDLFGFITPCSNSNPKVFMDESKALHNHNEYIYSFVCNRVKDDGKHGYGKSYIYGPIQKHEKDWLCEEGITQDEHNASILMHDSYSPSYSYGNFAIGKALSRFGRSDSYINTPKNIILKNLL